MLQTRGLLIVFNSRVVTDEMWVPTEPKAESLELVLSELLEPHDLTFREGSGGRLVIVRKGLRVLLSGSVRDGETGSPISGATVATQSGEQTESQGDGTFVLTALSLDEASPLDLRTTAAGYRTSRLSIDPADFEAAVVIELSPLRREFESIVVVPSQVTLSRETPVRPLTISKELAIALPGLSADPVRGLTVVPGITALDNSARLSVRGGPVDGTQLLFDGIELIEPFHLQDFGGASSIVAPEAVESIDVMTGGVSAEYGGRASGIVNMHSLVPRPDERTRLGVGLLDSHLSRAGKLPNDRGYWFGVGRFGTFDPALRFDGRRDRPSFWDLFGKIENRLDEGRLVRSRLLVAEDHSDFKQRNGDETEELSTHYQSGHFWSSYSMTPTPNLWSETTASFAALDRKRRAEAHSSDLDFSLDDPRSLRQIGVSQNLGYRLADQHTLSFGLDARQSDSRFRYRSEIDSRDPLAKIRTENESGSFTGALREEQISAYVSDLFRPFENLTLDVGARFEKYTLTDRADLTPRLAVAYWLPKDRVLRFSWGSFIQNQRPYELQVTDGETEFARAELSDQIVLSYEQPLTKTMTLGVEAYRRTTASPRARFVNLFEPRTAVPEVQNDRIQIAPERSEAEGVEILLRGSTSKHSWWGHYAHGRSKHRLDGRLVPSHVDQPDSVTLQFERRFGNRWTGGLVWRYHTGWPTTAVTGSGRVEESGELDITPVLGSLFAERLPTYHRLDLRVSKSWSLKKGKFDTYVEFQNLYNRRNVRGFEIEFVDVPLDAVQNSLPGRQLDIPVEKREKFWRGFFASFGVSWTF